MMFSDVYYAKLVSPEVEQTGTNFLAAVAGEMFGLYVPPLVRGKMLYVQGS